MLKATDIAYGAIVLSFILTISMVVTKNRHAQQLEKTPSWDRTMLAKLPGIPSMRLQETTNSMTLQTSHVGLEKKETESLPVIADISQQVSLYAKLMERHKGHIMLKCSADSCMAMTLKVHNYLGEEILEKPINAKPKARTIEINSSRLVAGEYFLTLTDNDRIKVTESFQIAD